MFSGIVECVGIIKNLKKEGTNLIMVIESSFSKEMYIDQSIAHDGVCLTVVAFDEHSHTVVAIDETLKKTTLSKLKIGQKINIEKAITADKMLDGHMVQGHVDCTSTCKSVIEKEGSWVYTFELPPAYTHLIVDKGSVTINGISLTVVNPTADRFSVAIIPYTHEHTNIHTIKSDDLVNVEFDILGKYITKYLSRMVNSENISKYVNANIQ